MAAPPPAVPRTAAPKPVKAETQARYRAEIRNLSTLVQQHRVSTNEEGKKMCSFVDEKLGEASAALDGSDLEGSWFHLYGAAKLCRTFRIQPEKSERAILRVKSLLGM
jgi:hypothetical protein